MNIFKNLIEKYRERYYIQKLDLADSAESNRLILLLISPLLFIFGVADIAVVFIVHSDNISEHVVSLVYYGVFTLISLYSFIASRKNKDVPREKAYIYKTIPVYMIFHTGLCMAVYNFYILDQPFNGFVTYCLSGFISLCVFSFSPFPFLAGLVIAMCFLAPGIYENFGVTGLMDAVLCPILMFCLSLYKRGIEKKHIMFLNKQKKSLEAKAFGNFTLMYEGKVVKFSRTKSNELLGYLVYKRGSSVRTKELISVLWGDSADSARYGSNLRNLIVDIKHTLNELQIQNFFIAEYNNFRINPEVIKCDYYDFLAGDPNAVSSFAGEFMCQFSWAEEIAGFLESKAKRA